MRRFTSKPAGRSPRRFALVCALSVCACNASGYVDNGPRAGATADASVPENEPTPTTNNKPDPVTTTSVVPSGGMSGTAPTGTGGTGGASAPVAGGSTGGKEVIGGGATGNGGGATGSTTPTNLPAAAMAILQARCASCHTYGEADPVGWGSALDVTRMVDAEIVVPGNPAASRMIDRVVVRGDMPPKGDRLSAADVSTLRAWITALKRTVKSPRTDDDILNAIAADQLSLRSTSSDYRYFSLAHFVDQARPAAEVTTARKVLTFTVNSLSRKGLVIPLVAIDSQGSIFRVKLSDLGWSAQLWDQLTSFYPYCLASEVAAHKSLYAQLGTEAPFVRGDWFMETATRSPLYEALIDLPATVDALAARLGLNIENDINHPGKAEPDNLVRIALDRSGVSQHNRMIERHLGAQGQYLWLSYDFATDLARQDVFANPLGPKTVDTNRFVHTFENTAGEIIFTLPNGMQGYMINDANGNRIADAAINVVRDVRRKNGVVQNGISCFGCHGSVGIIRPRATDEMSKYLTTHVADFQRREFDEISVLYPPVLMPDLLTADGNKYRATVDTLDGGGSPRGAAEYSDFVGFVGQYESSLGYRGVAAEFNEESTSFRQRVEANDPKNTAFPRSVSDPLISRDDFVCAFRALARKIRPQRFCAKTFNAAEVQGLCR